MTTVGTHPVLETQNRPTLVNLSSSSSQNTNSTKSSANWTLPFPISAEDDDFAAKVSLKSFSFYNTLNKNISERNNTLKIFTFVGGVKKIITVKIPIGQYSIKTLLAYLNKDTICNKFTGGENTDSSTFEGLGSVGDANYPPFFISPDDPTRICFQGCPLGSYQNPTGTPLYNEVYYDSGNAYSAVGLLIETETIPLLYTLGFISEISAPERSFIRFSNDSAPSPVLAFRIEKNGSENNYKYSDGTITNGVSTVIYKGVISMKLNTTSNIAVFLENISQSGRSSYEQFRPSNLLSVVPVRNGYGWRCHYEPANPFKAIVTNYTVNEVQILLLDAETGERVDFQGSNWNMTLEIEYYQIDNSKKIIEAKSNAQAPLLTKRMRAF